MGKLRRKLHAQRERVRAKRTLNLAYRISLGVLGGVVLVAGIVMVPYPGPGWLVVFAGLGILATEFHWAHSVNVFAKRHYHRWMEWLKRQNPITKLAVMSGTGLIVLLTLWLVGLFGTAASWVGLDWPWLSSPLFGP